MCLADLSMNGDFNLIVANLFDTKRTYKNAPLLKQQQHKIKVYRGINMAHEFTVDDKPVACCTVFDTINKPHLPILAVAVGSSIFYFKDFSPYLKFDLPMIEFSAAESDVWSELIKMTNSQLN